VNDEGKKFLKEREEVVDHIREHVKDWWGHEGRDEFRAAAHELRGLGRLLAESVQELDEDKWARIKGVISQAFKDVEDIIKR
jgi:hypothetical protein